MHENPPAPIPAAPKPLSTDTSPRAKRPRTLGVSAALRQAFRLMIEDGLTRAKAAEAVGMTDHGVYSALRKPHVKSVFYSIRTDVRQARAVLAEKVIHDLAQQGHSGHVRLGAADRLIQLGEKAERDHLPDQGSQPSRKGYVLIRRETVTETIQVKSDAALISDQGQNAPKAAETLDFVPLPTESHNAETAENPDPPPPLDDFDTAPPGGKNDGPAE